MKSSNFIKKRLKRYDNLKKDLKKKKIKFSDYNYLLEIYFSKTEINQIKKIVLKYILKSINIFFQKKFKEIKKISTIKNYLLRLPNIPPTGVIKLKKENYNEYVSLQKKIISILKRKNILKILSLLEFVEVRLMRSNINQYNSKRPYSSSKIHSDSWSGNPCDAKVALYILGDKKNTIEFFSPSKIDKNFFKKKINYETTIKKYGFKKIKKLNTNCMTIFDQSCLHKTLNYNTGLRISLDFGIIICESININKFTIRYKNNFFNPNKKNNFSALFDKKKIKSIFSKSY